MHRRLRVACLLLVAYCATLCAPGQAQDLAAVLAEADRLFDQKKWDEAIVKYDELLRLKPDHYNSLNNRGLCRFNKGELDRALADFDAALRIMPRYAVGLCNRGVVYAKKNDAEAALRDWSEAIRCDPKYVNAYDNRAALYLFRKNYDAAIGDYRQSLRLDPKSAPNYKFKIIGACAANPNVAALFDALAWLYATCPEAGVRDGKGAVLQAKAACSMSEYKNWAFLATLAAAYAEAGDFENAVTWAYGALDLAPEAEKGPLLERAKLFEKRQPYRDVLKSNAHAEGFVSLFNGKDLTGWSVDGGKPEQWSVAGAEIVGRSDSWRTRCYLLANKDYADFVLRFEFRIEGKDDHGGVAIRGIPGEKAPLDKQMMIFEHPLIKLRNGKKDNESLGTSHFVKNANINTPPLTTLELAPENWNRMEVTIRGDRCRATVGETSIVDVKLDQQQSSVFVPGLARSTGKVGFQINTGAVRFRKIEIQELPVDPK